MRIRLSLTLLAVIFARALIPSCAWAAGINVDAGLTPPEDRWILRTQVRYMQREEGSSGPDAEMDRYAFPLVLAYGARPDLTLMMRQTVFTQDMTMGGSSEEDCSQAESPQVDGQHVE